MLDDCPGLWGYATVVRADPRIEVHRDVLFVPGGSGGLFDRGRRLLTGSGYYRGLPSELGSMSLVHGSVFSPVDPDTVHDTFDDPVAFGGVLIAHFGHFLIGTLSRFWNETARTERHVVINAGDFRPILALPFYQDMLPALGLTSESFVGFDRPIRLREVVLTWPSFDENSLVHDAYARMCARLGRSLCPTPEAASAPVFLSKSKLPAGISRVENEDDLCQWLERRGVRIAYPETMPLADQIGLFRGGQPITGFMGSAFHLSAFAPGCRLVAINHSPDIISNQVLIDRVSGNMARYVFGTDTFTALGERGPFQRCYALNDVERTGAELLNLLERQSRDVATVG